MRCVCKALRQHLRQDPPPRVAMPPPAGFLPLGSSEGFTSLHVRLQWSFALLLRKHSFLECMGK